jgi:tRNA threonylcarbamoyladenosine biosynthesis protein TsaB
MIGILAIETATDACSVAVSVDGHVRERHEVAPRQHSQLLFAMLEELLPGGTLKEQGIDLIAYGCGPGSFTGLRIVASAVQGLAYSCDLPAVAVSTLAIMAQSAYRKGRVSADDTVLCALDARINEVYGAVYGYVNGLAVECEGPWACAPSDLMPTTTGTLRMVGDGCRFFEELPQALRARTQVAAPDLVPAARDLIPLALAEFERGNIQSPAQVQPVYVRDEISWKKLAEQGKRT